MNFVLAALILLCFSTNALSHGTEKHGLKVEKEPSGLKANGQCQQFIDEINSAYERSIKPIFIKKCMDCHSGKTNYPWYYRIPGARGLIDEDIAEGRKHLQIDNGFPFKSHATMVEDLSAIKKSAVEQTMPPLRYRMLHWDSGLSEKEIAEISSWTMQSKKRLLKSEENCVKQKR